MDISFINTIIDKLKELGNFLFGSISGVGILLGSFLIISLIVAIVLEKRTRKIYKNIPKEEELNKDDWDENED